MTEGRANAQVEDRERGEGRMTQGNKGSSNPSYKGCDGLLRGGRRERTECFGGGFVSEKLGLPKRNFAFARKSASISITGIRPDQVEPETQTGS